ncbi:MAG: DNA polymerase III subunit delta' [bacterium]
MWSNIIGHTRQIEQLRRALDGGRLPNAYLFTGPRGIGKRRVADTFAASLFCLAARERDWDPCGDCVPCHKLTGHNHPDFFLIEPMESERGAVQSIKIDPLRELKADLQFHPLEAPAKIAIIDGADRLVDAAANSLLKILEEPPDRTHFIMITPFPERLLPTIRSRCQHMPFSPLPDSMLAEALILRKQLPEREAMRIARLAGGSLGTAEALDPEFVEAVLGRFLALTSRASSADIFETAQAWKDLDPSRTLLIFDLLASFYRDVLRFQATHEKDDVIHPEAAGPAGSCTTEHAIRCLAEIDSTRLAAETSANKQLMFEQLLFTLSRQ